MSRTLCEKQVGQSKGHVVPGCIFKYLRSKRGFDRAMLCKTRRVSCQTVCVGRAEKWVDRMYVGRAVKLVDGGCPRARGTLWWWALLCKCMAE